jgi:hypothetical protein
MTRQEKLLKMMQGLAALQPSGCKVLGGTDDDRTAVLEIPHPSARRDRRARLARAPAQEPSAASAAERLMSRMGGRTGSWVVVRIRAIRLSRLTICLISRTD